MITAGSDFTTAPSWMSSAGTQRMPASSRTASRCPSRTYWCTRVTGSPSASAAAGIVSNSMTSSLPSAVTAGAQMVYVPPVWCTSPPAAVERLEQRRLQLRAAASGPSSR